MIARPEDAQVAVSQKQQDAMRQIVDAYDADILILNAPIERHRDRRLINTCKKRKCRPNLFMIVVTNGGDPDAAYRLARCVQNRYEKVIGCVSGYCKSAGTLLLLGAHELVFSEHGEMGPLDIQMAKKDELWESESGLTVTTALTALHENAQDAFDHFLLSLTQRSGGRITVRTASEIAAKLTQALYAPISEQIDTIHMGEIYRSMAIAREYGKRLMEKSRNFESETLHELISNFPSHGFVIDGEEAGSMFKNVRPCTAFETALLDELGQAALTPMESPWVRFISDDIEDQPNDATTQNAPVLEGPPVIGTPQEAAQPLSVNGQAGAATVGE